MIISPNGKGYAYKYKPTGSNMKNSVNQPRCLNNLQ